MVGHVLLGILGAAAIGAAAVYLGRQQSGSIDDECGGSTDFGVGDMVFYPTHGVGRIVEEEVHVASFGEVNHYVIDIPQNGVRIKVPKEKAVGIGVRKMKPDYVDGAFAILAAPAPNRHDDWVCRAAEYDMKIGSGRLDSLAEVVRDLHYVTHDKKPAYSAVQLYQTALERMCRELAAIQGISEDEAKALVERALADRAVVAID